MGEEALGGEAAEFDQQVLEEMGLVHFLGEVSVVSIRHGER